MVLLLSVAGRRAARINHADDQLLPYSAATGPLLVVSPRSCTTRSMRSLAMMPIWSPGFYRVEDYASRVQSLSARTSDGKTLAVEQPQKNRWRVFLISGSLICSV